MDLSQSLGYLKTGLSTDQIKSLREGVIRGIDFIEKHKVQISQEDYKDLFQNYQHILNTYNNMIDRNIIQSKYIDNRTIVQVQPIIDGRDDYNTQSWEKQFTANNLNVQPYMLSPPQNTFRQVKDTDKFRRMCAKEMR